MASTRHDPGPTLIDQLLSALHEEIAPAAEKHRLAVVLSRPRGHDPAPGRRRAEMERTDGPAAVGRGAPAAQGPPGPPWGGGGGGDEEGGGGGDEDSTSGGITEDGWNFTDPVTHGQRGRVAVSDPDGRFHFELDKSASDFPY